jgi:hypothetical protein
MQFDHRDVAGSLNNLALCADLTSFKTPDVRNILVTGTLTINANYLPGYQFTDNWQIL